MDILPDQNTSQGLSSQPPVTAPVPSPYRAPIPGPVLPDNQGSKKKTILYLVLIIALILIAGVLSITLIPLLKPQNKEVTQEEPSSTINTQTIALIGVDSGNEYGKISRNIGADRIEWIVEISPLGFEPPEGVFLQIWLDSDAEKSSLTPLAKLLRQDDGSYLLQIEESLVGTNPNPNQFKNFVIMSLESVDDLSVEGIVARGEFKENR